MKTTMICNVIIEAAWIGGMVYLIINGHPYWAGACFLGALFSGYTFKQKGE